MCLQHYMVNARQDDLRRAVASHRPCGRFPHTERIRRSKISAHLLGWGATRRLVGTLRLSSAA